MGERVLERIVGAGVAVAGQMMCATDRACAALCAVARQGRVCPSAVEYMEEIAAIQA